jgi:hypothetical protein
MKWIVFTLLILFSILNKNARAISNSIKFVEITESDDDLNALLFTSDFSLSDRKEDSLKSLSNTVTKSKGVAITLAITLGVFGVHRLYLGTSNKVPIIYTLTLGGGFGALMVSDIIAIIATPDINTFSPSDKVFMWAK